MKIGIVDIGYHIATARLNMLNKAQMHDVTPAFIQNKIGFVSLARKAPSQKASDLCVKAYKNLVQRVQYKAALEDIAFICVCTQNGDYQIPQTSAIVQDKLGISSACASFDIIGCREHGEIENSPAIHLQLHIFMLYQVLMIIPMCFKYTISDFVYGFVC